ncbi:formylglycine-generating enzyme family protein [Aliiroseovarius sp. M344]|uniref:formylglycine-generating enzyme family protein n=1 Tax=Aliiroseovarius sp. M344 TaxID=2867010 RepID=UPI0021ADB483|nr:formylglycine-generating enzyme family protein [Aliiroseovarius sp. M344]UWQ13084.1 formylglycine-generating enzyme family protein [Aliiroseovarius sp. M344]
MTKSSSNLSSKYLPFVEFHIAELTGIKPDHIRGSARRLGRDREDIKYNSTLNCICKELGFKGGFAGYKKNYERDIEEFMARHSLVNPGLFEPEILDRPIRIGLKQISDRWFQSAHERPSRIFTGAGVEWADLLGVAMGMSGFKVVNPYTRATLCHEDEIDRVRQDPPNQWVIRSGGHSLAFSKCMELNNLLGDQLLSFRDEADPNSNEFVSQLYFPSSMASEDVVSEQEESLGGGRILSALISNLEQGWVDLIPFNEKLVFLRDGQGGFDFVFPRFRPKSFNHNIHSPFLKNADVPKSDDSYHFKRWLYFEYDGWREQDQHAAESAFYELGGCTRNYPGEDEILRAYLQNNSRYSAPFKKAPLAEGFKKVRVGDRYLAVSDPISISRFREFMTIENELYAAYRPTAPDQDDWEQCNVEGDVATAPASVTWYDACAYAASVSKKRKLPVRLPTEEEWLEICHEFRSALNVGSMDTHYRDADRIVEKGARSLIHGFFGTGYNCAEADLPWEKTKDGISFLRAIDFGEWLLPEGAVINSRHFGAMNMVPLHLMDGQDPVANGGASVSPKWGDRVSATRDRMSPKSTGAYKDWRIGFRLVYEIDGASEPEDAYPDTKLAGA